jgi:hypothetical protein
MSASRSRNAEVIDQPDECRFNILNSGAEPVWPRLDQAHLVVVSFSSFEETLVSNAAA